MSNCPYSTHDPDPEDLKLIITGHHGRIPTGLLYAFWIGNVASRFLSNGWCGDYCRRPPYFLFHSERRLFAGLTTAAFMAWKLTVASAIIRATIADNAKTHQWMGIL